MLTKVIYSVVAIVIILFVASVVWQMNAYKAAEPDYSVLRKEGNIEIRQYSPMIVAQVKVSGERREAIRKGFKMLAEYIFGGNHKDTKIQMTAPVMQEKTMISMTAPVIQHKEEDSWVVSFVMPKSYNMNTLPKPNNPNVTLMAEQSRKFVVIQFSGLSSSANIDRNRGELDRYIKENKLNVIGEPIMAYYNPPWIWPFLRRNEIMYQLQ